MKRTTVAVLIALAAAPSAFPQRDFLTTDEVEKIREAQEPNIRLQIYLLFARQRLDQLQQQITKDRKGRSLEVRQLLDEYTQIIDAIDTVSDDALKRKVDIQLGTTAVAEAEQKFLAQLKKIEASQPHDLDMFAVALKNAIGDTDDSIQTTHEDLGKRSAIVAAKAEKEKKDVESLTGKEALKQQKAEDAKTEAKAEDGQSKRKPPTLYRPGEKPATPAP